jgi:hypothetical protein
MVQYDLDTINNIRGTRKYWLQVILVKRASTGRLFMSLFTVSLARKTQTLNMGRVGQPTKHIILLQNHVVTKYARAHFAEDRQQTI